MNNYLSWVCYDCYAYEANGVDALTYIEDDTDNPVLCGYRGDDCFPGAMYEDGVHCHYCR